MLASSLAGSFRKVTVTTSPLHRGEYEVSRKAIAQGMSECSPLTCMLVCANCATLGTRDRGCSAHPAFPAPSLRERDNEIPSSDADRVARTNTHVSASLRAKRSNPSIAEPHNGLLRRKRSSQLCMFTNSLIG